MCLLHLEFRYLALEFCDAYIIGFLREKSFRNVYVASSIMESLDMIYAVGSGHQRREQSFVSGHIMGQGLLLYPVLRLIKRMRLTRSSRLTRL